MFLRGSARLIRHSILRPARYYSTNQSSPNEQAKTLSHYLAQSIKATGPIPLASYMRQCLTNPTGGYYITKDPFGSKGDFVTSPEISQMFGELVGIWILTQWMHQGRPESFRLIELGPGRGTLMSDLLRTAKQFSPFAKALKDIYMVEASPKLRQIQCKRLAGEDAQMLPADQQSTTPVTTLFGNSLYWLDSLKEVPRTDVPTYVVAHEFFDALPIHQFEHTQNGWRELVVDYGVKKSPILLPNQSIEIAGKEEKPEFFMTVNPTWTPGAAVVPQTDKRYSSLPVGSKIEICPEAWQVADQIASLIQGKGAALIVDYGPADTIPVDSLRGIVDHNLVSPFEEPGTADLSADVDFGALAIAAKKKHDVKSFGPVQQGDWLHSMGIGARATQLAEKQDDEGKKRVEQAYKRLVEKSGGAMGKVYKVMALTSKDSPEPVGFGGAV